MQHLVLGSQFQLCHLTLQWGNLQGDMAEALQRCPTVAEWSLAQQHGLQAGYASRCRVHVGTT